MKFNEVMIFFHRDKNDNREFGPVYGSIPLPDTLPVTNGMTQAMPCRSELVEVRKKHERVAAAYEIAIWYLLAANDELGERTKSITQLESENAALKAALKRARDIVGTPGLGLCMREFAEELGITPTLLSTWTSDPITAPPQFVD